MVVGGGGWGTALARLLALPGRAVGLWCREPEVALEISTRRENPLFLPGVSLPAEIEPFTDLGRAAGAELLVMAVPVQHLRRVAEELAPHLAGDALLINGAKGLEIGSGLRPSEILRQVLGRARHVLTLSGPSHAEEVAKDQPCAVVVAGARARLNRHVQHLLNSETFRVYTTTDQVGVEIAGALKNVIALAAGIAEGLGFGDNTRAALATRGLAEMAHLGEALGAEAATFSGLAGMGDLFATLASEHSRNHVAGREIGRGRDPAEVAASTPMVIEGIPTCRAALTLAARCRMEMPIVERMGAVLFDGMEPRAAVADLMRREPTAERIPWFTRWRGRGETESAEGVLAGVRRRYDRLRRRTR
ncbi:MAG: NAD(P)H-dependent glycerol-3-phosphate dehydrogenase [Patescibacteria group bacterium]